MHEVKVAYHDLGAKTHTTAGGARAVDSYRCGVGWLYMARPLVGHPELAYVQAFLIPALGIQVNRWRHHPGSSFTWYDYYVDIMAITSSAQCWVSRDYYLDVVVVEGRSTHVLDTDEYLQALSQGLLSPEEAGYALEKTHGLLNGLADHGYRLQAWLESEGVALPWPHPS